MAIVWKITAFASHDTVEAALLAHEETLDWDADIVIAGSEVADDRPDDWQVEAWLPRKPTKADKAAIAALFPGNAPDFVIERLPETDWVTQSQQGLEPIRAGRFHVRTPDHPALDEPGVTDFLIPASQAFGTGQHETTAGCLAMLDAIRASGAVVRNCADIGTGSGLLALAALDLWPRALATASDIDAVCLDVVAGNALANGIAMGAGPGEVTMLVANGMEHPLLAARGPYDLIMANILAGPLISLAPDFSRALVPGGHLLLSGLLATQEPAVRRACRLAGLRLAARMTHGDWSILWLRKRATVRARAARTSRPPRWSQDW
jgi:ribosomal protein L11 methyltransferase